VRPLTDTEAGQVLETAASRSAGQRLALRLLLEYRLTAHEICRLTVDQVDGATLSVGNKRGAGREIELQDAAAVAELQEVLRDHSGGQLFAGPTSRLRPDALRRLLRSASTAAGVEDEISIHRNRGIVDVRA
jgi:integrase